MRTSEERARDVLERRDAYRKTQQRRQSLIAMGVLCGALVLSIGLGMLPQWKQSAAPAAYTELYSTVERVYEQHRYTNVNVFDMEIAGVEMEKAPDGTADAATGTHSETNVQVQGVDESDIVKTDGTYLYVLTHGACVKIVDPNGGQPRTAATITPENKGGGEWSGMYVAGDRLVLIRNCHTEKAVYTEAWLYDITNPEQPQYRNLFRQNGYELSTRLIGDVLYTVTRHEISQAPQGDKPETYVPQTGCGGEFAAMPAEDIYISEDSLRYVVVTAVRIAGEEELLSQKAVLTEGETVYANTENLYVAGSSAATTALMRFALNNGKLEKQAQTTLNGTLLNQFSLDEYNGYLRVVLTTYGEKTGNGLLVLDSALKTVGSITDLAPDERVYSVRFSGDTGYFVTFRQVDPLFTVDLSDPTKPTIQSELKIPGFSQYLHPYGEGLLLGIGMNADEQGRTDYVKLSMFDVRDPAAVTEAAVEILPEMYAEVLGNHKAALIDMEKDIIGFAADNRYYVYGYTPQTGFVCKAALNLLGSGKSTRGVYIGEVLYLISADGVGAYRLSDFEPLGTLGFFDSDKTVGTVWTSLPHTVIAE